jgi:cholesterol transport system auxiliary component
MIRNRIRLADWKFGGLVALVALAVLAGACTALKPPQAENVSLYVLTPEARPAPTRGERDVVVEVAAPRAWPSAETTRIAYVRQPFEVEYFAASRWADTPPRMLAPLLARALEERGGFRAAIRAPSAVPADFRLDTEIIRLQQDFGVRPSRVDIMVRAQLIDIRGRRIVAGRAFAAMETADSETAAAGVVAANTALQRVLEQIVDFCVAETARR